MPSSRPLLAALVVVAALIGPASASASWFSIDDNGNTTPNGQGSAPDEAASNGSSSSSSGGGYTMTEATIIDINDPDECEWEVKGRLIVRNPTVSGLADGDPVEGVKVKVSGRSATGAALGAGFNEWDTDVTDANGEFAVPKTECKDRRVKVEAEFESDDLRVSGPTSPTWYELYDSLDEVSPREIDIAGEPFGGESGDQSTTQARIDAQTWILYRRAMDYVDGTGFSFLNDITVHNPATLAPNGSWTDPILHDIHIAPQFTSNAWNMLHELGHAWAYPREIGEGCLTWAALQDGDTHDFQEEPCAAWNEGLSNFFASKLIREMNAHGLISVVAGSVTPLKRADLAAQGLVSLTSLERNELGWEQAFRVLTAADLTRDLFGPGFGNTGSVSTYAGPLCPNAPSGLGDLADALRAVGDSNDQFDLQDSGDPSMADFFNRAADRLAGFDPLDSVKYADTVDPTEDIEPHEAYGC